MSDETKTPQTAEAHNALLTGAVKIEEVSTEAPKASHVGEGLAEAWRAFQSIEDTLKDILAARASVTSDRLKVIADYVNAGKAGIIKAGH